MRGYQTQHNLMCTCVVFLYIRRTYVIAMCANAVSLKVLCILYGIGGKLQPVQGCHDFPSGRPSAGSLERAKGGP